MKYDADILRQRLRQIMADHGLDVTNWCREAGLNEATLRSFLNGKSNSLRVDTVIALANAINMKPSRMIGEEQEIPEQLILEIQREVFDYIEREKLIVGRDRAFVAIAALVQEINSIEELKTRGSKLIDEFLQGPPR